MKRREGVGSCEERRVFAGSGWAATKGEWRVGGVQLGGRGGGVSEKRERVKRGYGSQPRPGQAQSTQCKNANTPPPPPGPLPKKNGG